MLSRDDTLREMTLRICCGLETKETLRHAFEYLSKWV
jgi:hypothetical protein